MTLRDRLEWLSRMALMAFILASVAFLSALTAMRFAVQGREVAVPDLVGKPAADARRILQGRGVGMKVEDRIYSNFPVDAVVRQSPLPNMRVKTGQNAHVVLSLGPRSETVPQLTGENLRAAQIELLRAGMQAGEVSALYVPGAPAGDIVLQQSPTPGATAMSSPHVDMLVSLGPRPADYAMPDVTGLPLGEAEARLSAVGLKLWKLTPSAIPNAPHDSVVGQTPSRGQRVDPSMVIELRVAE